MVGVAVERWVIWFFTSLAFGHPMGVEGWATYTAVRATASGPEVVVAVEIPLQEGLERFKSFAKTSRDPEVEDAYRAQVWEEMARGLSLVAETAEVPGRWVPVWTAMNGLAAETGFLYLLRFEPTAGHRWAGFAEITVLNEAFSQHTMWRSAWVEPVADCRITTNSALETLPFLSPDPMTSREVWRQDTALKRLTVGWACDKPAPTKTTLRDSE